MMKPYLRNLAILLIIFAASCGDEDVRIPRPPDGIDLTNSFYYVVNLNDRSGDTFKVQLFVGNLTGANDIFQFVSTVPGIYDYANIGRYVKNFRVYDENYKSIESGQVSENQWQISRPEDAFIIEYEVSETFDTPVDEYEIYMMAGTSIENDHVLFNTFDVLGYPKGLSSREFFLNIKHPSGWSVGTSLENVGGNTYRAQDFDRLSDSPLLLGSLSSVSTTVDATDVGVYTYSKNKLVTSVQLLSDINPVLSDAKAFLNGLPVDHYNFLFFFDDMSKGALEHSYSSVYVLREASTVNVRNIAAHEFFHIVTPLNIHSEIISNFNYETPTPSEHLWLYEGVTEWAAQMMQYRNQSMSFTTLLGRLRGKIAVDKNNYTSTFTLSQIALECYTPEGQDEYGNIYNRGAIVATLLDIRLLELSGGTMGLRELILQLIDTYGPEKAFSEETFFEDLVAMTYPEIGDFINSYIKNAEPLPLAEYFAKIGVVYDDNATTLTPMDMPSTEQLALREIWSVNF